MLLFFILSSACVLSCVESYYCQHHYKDGLSLVKETYMFWNQAIRAGDIAALASRYTDNVEIIAPGFPPVRGKTAATELDKRLSSDVVSVTISFDGLVAKCGDLFVVRVGARGMRADGNKFATSGLTIFRIENGVAKASLGIWNSDGAPSGTPPQAQSAAPSRVGPNLPNRNHPSFRRFPDGLALVKKTYMFWNQAVRAGDITALASRYTDDVEAIAPGFPPVRGKKAATELDKRLLSDIVSVTFSFESLVAKCGNTFVVRGGARGVTADGNKFAISGVAIFRIENGVAKASLGIWNSDGAPVGTPSQVPSAVPSRVGPNLPNRHHPSFRRFPDGLALVKKTYKFWNQAARAGDITALASRYTDDVEAIAPGFPPVRGKKATSHLDQRFLSEVVSITFSFDGLVAKCGDLFIVRDSARGLTADGNKFVISGLTIFRIENGVAKASLGIWNSDDAPSGTPPTAPSNVGSNLPNRQRSSFRRFPEQSTYPKASSDRDGLTLVKETYMFWNQALRARDVAAVVSRYTEDVEVVPPGSAPIRGKKAVTELGESRLSDVASVTLSFDGLVAKCGDLFVARDSAQRTTVDGNNVDTSGLTILRIENGVAKASLVIWNSDDAPSGTPPQAPPTAPPNVGPNLPIGQQRPPFGQSTYPKASSGRGYPGYYNYHPYPGYPGKAAHPDPRRYNHGHPYGRY